MSKALVLDLDRTLVDVQTFTDYSAAVADVEREMGVIELVDVPDTDWRSATLTAMAMLVALAGEPERWQQASDLIERHELAAVEQAVAMPGLDGFLAATAGVPRAIATLMGPTAMDAVCERFAIDVPLRVGRESDMVPKPAPDQVLRACGLLAIDASDATMLGDSTWDREAALAAGAGFVGLTNGRPSEFPPDTILAADLNAAVPLLVS